MPPTELQIPATVTALVTSNLNCPADNAGEMSEIFVPMDVDASYPVTSLWGCDADVRMAGKNDVSELTYFVSGGT